ncbi:MAG: hypothetical protein A4E53_03808 [Pelotomaculum sp. PtaB.Bin104]|nr:MAG: hypothetical protein A4E53_03808 [Pelotomaculum sp. PtaB.Bin104]
MVRNKWICAFLVFLFSLCMVSVPHARAANVDAASLKQMFDQQGNPARWAFLKNAVDGFTLPWVETYVMRSYLLMYQATGDKSYIDAFVDHADSVLNRRDSVRKVSDHRGYSLPVWRNGDNADNTYYIFADETGLIATPLAQFGALVKADPNLASYKVKADKYVQAAKDAVNVLFMSELKNEVSFNWIDTGDLLYINRPINKNLAVGCAMLAIYEATGEKAYLEKGIKIANFFKQRLLINPSSNSYYWMYYPDDPLNRYNNTPEDTNHANVAVQFIKLAYDNGIFSETEMQRFANTATKVLVKKDGTIAGRLDGSGTVAQQGMIASWLFFEPWAPSLFDIAYNIDAKLQKNDEVVGLALLNYVFAQRNSSHQPTDPEPDPDPNPNPGPVDNLIANADFSAGAAGWVNLNNTAVINTEASGNKYLINTYNFSFYQDLKVEPGGTYKLNASTRKGTATKGARIVFRFYHENASESFKTFTYKNSGSGWEAMPQMTVQVPSTVVATKIYLSALPGDSGNQHFDDITLVPAGDTPAPAPDTIAPVAAIRAPAAGSVLKDKATLEAAASDNVGVTQITLAYATSAQGSRTTIGAAALSGGSQAQGTWRLTWDVSGQTNGTYYVWATAKDAAGNTSTSGPVTYEIKKDVQDLIVNGNFSAGATGWVNLNNAAVINTEASGNKYLANTYNFSFYQELNVQPGGTYKLNASTRKGTAVKGARIVFRFYHQDGSESFKTFTYQNNGTGWEAMPEMTVQVPSTAKATKIYLSALPGDSGKQHFDDITLKKAN